MMKEQLREAVMLAIEQSETKVRELEVKINSMQAERKQERKRLDTLRQALEEADKVDAKPVDAAEPSS